MLQLLNCNSDIIVAKGNSLGIVINVEDIWSIRSEVSHNDEINVQRLSKARQPHS